MKTVLALLGVLVLAATGFNAYNMARGYRAGRMEMLFSRRSDSFAVRGDGDDNFRFGTTTVLNAVVLFVSFLMGLLLLYTALVL